MSKSQLSIAYVPESMRDLSVSLVANRKGIESLPPIDLDMYGLEEAVKALPKNHRISLEKFFGLVPLTRNHYKIYCKKKSKHIDTATKDMAERACSALFQLYEFDYIKKYDFGLQDLINNILEKIDSSDTTISDDEVIKYFLIYLLIIDGGANFSFDFKNDDISAELEASVVFDHYAILHQSWINSLQFIEDKSLRISPVVEYVHLLPLKERVKILQMMDLPIPKDLEFYLKGEPLKTFAKIRKFKQHLFPSGPWCILEKLIFSDCSVDFSALSEKIHTSNWLSYDSYEKCRDVEIILPTETKTIPEYQIGQLKFTDLEEVIFLYLARRIIEK